jgi:hypothetical protein
MTGRRGMDESPLSDFLVKMRDAHRRRLAAVSLAEKRAIEREMHALIRKAGEADGDAAPESDRPETPTVPRATRRRARPGPAKYSHDGFDHKLAQAGEREDDE